MKHTTRLHLICICVGICCAGVFGYIVFCEYSRHFLTVAFLDIGQGDAIYIEAPNGNKILVDGGPGSAVISELTHMMLLYDRHIDAVLATHTDSDHIGGLPDVLRRFDVAKIIKTEVQATSSVLTEFVVQGNAKKIPITLARRGQRFVLDAHAEVYLDILFPERAPTYLETNTSSIVAILRYKKTSVLLTGDSPKGVEKFLSEVDDKDLHVNILKLGHHGSHTSSDEIFLRTVHPDLAIVSAGKNNKYGHPHKDVLERLDRLKIPYLTTMDHRLVFQSDGTTIWEQSNLER